MERPEIDSGRFFSRDRFVRPGLTGLRALAAAWVFAFHLNAFAGGQPIGFDLGSLHVVLTPLVTLGWVGVDVFFVLSGFLLSVHWLEHGAEGAFATRYLAYLRARILRVVPAYWAQIAVLLAIAVVLTGSAPAWLPLVPSHLVMLQNFSIDQFEAINGIYWSVPVEFSFYLVLPFALAALAPGRVPRAGRTALMVGAAIAIMLAWRHHVQADFGARGTHAVFWAAVAQLPGDLDQFAMGVAAAVVWRRHPPRAGDALLIAGAIALVAWLYLFHYRYEGYWAGSWLFYAWHPVACAFIALMVLGIAGGGPVSRALFENRAILWVGTVSYSLYLWHMPLVASLAPAFGRDGLVRFALVLVPIVLAASACSYYAVERPFMRRKARPSAGA